MIEIDALPIHWGTIFQLVVIVSVCLIGWQIKLTDLLDRMRHHATMRFLFRLRKGMMFFEAMALCWVVVYTHSKGWQPWPPIVVFLIAFDINMMTHIMVMRADVARLGRPQPMSGAGNTARR